MGIISIIEILPLLYNLILASFAFSHNTPPSYFTDYFSYISYYDQIHNQNKGAYNEIIFWVAIIILLFFLIFKYILIRISSIRTNFIFKVILSNFYEFLLLKIGIIFCFDIFVNRIFQGTIQYTLLGTLFVTLTFFGVFYHYNLHHVYISLMPLRTSSFDNFILLMSDKYFLKMKLLITFIKHCADYQLLSYFLNFLLVGINIAFFFNFIYTVFINKLVYIPSLFTVYTRVFYCLLTSTVSFYIIILRIRSGFILLFVSVNLFIISFYLFEFFQRKSIEKLTQKGNEIGTIIYLINEHQSPNISSIVQSIILNHKARCQDKHCTFCSYLSDNSQDIVSFEQLCFILFKSVIKDQKMQNSDNQLEFLAYYNLCELYVLFLNDKNYIKLLLKYHKIKNMFRHSTKTFHNQITILNQNLSKTFLLTLELLFDEISYLLVNLNENLKNSFLINIDGVTTYINEFLTEMKEFFDLSLKTPREVFKLANNFSLIKEKVNVNFLSLKENKFNYTCLISGYILEEMFNDRINKNISFIDTIHSADDLLKGHFLNDKLILLSFDIINSSFTIQQCGKELIDYKGQNFEKLFPPFIRNEGKRKMINTLEIENKKIFEYYFYNKSKETIERFKMSFIGVPSFSSSSNFLDLICTYRIPKDNLLLFEEKHLKVGVAKALVMTSESLGHYLKIDRNDIIKTHEKKKYITERDLFTEEGKLLDMKTLQMVLKTKIEVQNNTSCLKSNFINVTLKEQIAQYDIYLVRSGTYQTNSIDKDNTLYSARKKKTTEVEEEDELFTGMEADLDMHFTPTQTNITSSTFTQTSSSNYNKTLKTIKDEQNYKYQQFFRFTYYLIFFNVVILIIIIIFLVVELTNNSNLERIFQVIRNYFDFQNYFYSASISLFSLTCNADYLSQIDCVNAFLTFGQKFNNLHGLTENELVTDYVSREINYKSDKVISTLKFWEMNHQNIKSKKKEQILNENFEYDIIVDVDEHVSTSSLSLTFEESIKRFSNNINLLTSYPDFLTSPVFTVTSDGKGFVDMKNTMLEKNPNPDGTYLNESQKIYYTLVLNFQKFILRLLKIGNILYDYYNEKIDSTTEEVLCFIVALIILHLLMMFMCIVFIFKFKVIHLNFFITIYQQTSDSKFNEYYSQKIEYLQTLLEFYRDSPINIINKIVRLKQKVKNKKIKEMKSTTDVSLAKGPQSINNKSQMNYEQLNSIYNNDIIFIFIIQIVVLFFIYYIICIILFLVIKQSIHNLTLMNLYTRNNYDLSNNVYVNLGLIQLMAFTNQTDAMLSVYFTENGTDTTQGHYVRDRIEQVFSLLMEIYQMEKNNHFFTNINALLNFECERLYPSLNDELLETMIKDYPQSDYRSLFREYCQSFEPLNTYQDPKLTIMVISYETASLLDMFVDRRYETYAKINNCDLIYQLYSEIILLLQPVRRYVYTYLSEQVIQNIISNYSTLMIFFLVFNFVYEVIILLYVKFHIINSIINYSKEVIIVAKAFECFSV